MRRSLPLDGAILHRVFSYGIELEMIVRNPVRLEGRRGEAPECGAQPFKVEELSKLSAAAGLDSLAFLLLRWTGLRGSDVVTLRWAEVDFRTGAISRVTLKRRKRVVVQTLARGVNPYRVARLVRITVEVLEKHYAPFIPKLRERVRRALDSGEGLKAMPRESTDSQQRKERIQ